MKRPLLGAGVLFCAAAELSSQTDHYNLERGFPTHLEDAYPIAYRGREVQLLSRYERLEDSEDRLVLEPAFELGFARNWQGRVSVPFLVDDVDSRGSGDVRLSVLHNFNQEAASFPALSLTAGVDVPTGEDSEGLDTHLGLLLTRTLDDERFGRAHVNLEWEHNSEALSDERGDLFAAALGYSMRFSPDAIGVLDLVREWGIEEDVESNLLEGGVRYQLHPRAVLSLGAGMGLGDESPDGRATLAIQLNL